MDFVSLAAITLQLALVLLGLLIFSRLRHGSSLPQAMLDSIATIRSDIAEMRDAIRAEARDSREDLRSALTTNSQTLEIRLSGMEMGIGTRLAEFVKTQSEQLREMRLEAANGRAKLEESIQRNANAFAEAQSARLKETNDAVASLFDRLLATQKLARDEQERALQAVATRLSGMEVAITTQLGGFGQTQSEQLKEMRLEAVNSRSKLEESIQRNSSAFAEAQSARLKETNDAVASLSDRLLADQKAAREDQALALDAVAQKVGQLILSNAEKQDAIKTAMTVGLDKLRAENGEKLEAMRATVDEKLQGTLDKRLGESFQIVSDRLDLVHKGLGEMQTLATGVGDLKRVLSNVKSRGAWGEIQLGMLIEDMLTREQYGTNVRVRPDSGEIVEFAVRLPGRGEEDQLWLPIDAKFPQEDYDRLLTAQESGVQENVEKAGAALERAIKLQAKTISEKYVHPPYTTDFAILYLPTEGLFSEVVRRPGLMSELQTKFRIMVQGPTTLAALLTSLQMGFRTLAIEKRSSEVWTVLAAAKAEFEKYGHLWDKLGKQLDTARRTVEDAGKRTRAVSRTLRRVETLEPASSPDLTELVAPTPANVSDDALADAA